MTSPELTRYDDACRALAEAKAIDEVRDIRNVAVAMAAYARQAKNRNLEADAIELRMRATRRLDQLRQAQKQTVGLNCGAAGGGQKNGPRGLVINPRDVRPTLASQGVDKNLAQAARVLGALPDDKFEQAVATARDAVSRAFKSVVGAAAAEQRREASRSAAPLPDGMELRIGDCRAVLADVPDNSAALVLTDPPWGNQAEPLLRWLADFAARVLTPGGSLVCFAGKACLDRDLAIFSARLRWHWLLSREHDQKQRFPGKFVISSWRAVVWYVKEHRRGRSMMPDVLKTVADKSEHRWAQGTGEGIEFVIEHLTLPGELIIDPFAGSTAWGKQAVAMGRRWLGADIKLGGTESVVAGEVDRGTPLDEGAKS
jgi:hypothetical protein